MPVSPHRRRLRASALLAAFVLPALGAGCGGPSGPATLTVLATSSMTEVLGEIGEAYHQQNPGVRLRFAFGGTPEIADRLAEHEPADVLVTADGPSMDEADEVLGGRRRVIARDALTIAVGPGNPAGSGTCGTWRGRACGWSSAPGRSPSAATPARSSPRRA